MIVPAVSVLLFVIPSEVEESVTLAAAGAEKPDSERCFDYAPLRST